jgi:pimeloyl-ACP methyl ester carboxylesterase
MTGTSLQLAALVRDAMRDTCCRLWEERIGCRGRTVSSLHRSYCWLMLDIRFAESGETQIAYTVVGDGPADIVYVFGAWSHLEVIWELPAFRRWCELLGEFARVILFDKRGMGMSDRVAGSPPLDVRMDDIRAVMDAAGSDSATLIGESEGGPLCMLFAATHPERTTGLVLMGSEVRELKNEEWPWGEATAEEFEASMAALPEGWGKPGGRFMEVFAPSQESTPWLADWSVRLQSNANTPRGAEAHMRLAFDVDVRDVAPTIHVPTLVLHSEGDRVCHVENGRFLARTIPNARYIELPGADHLPFFDPQRAMGEIREMVTGSAQPTKHNRVLATVLFTDIVKSTEEAVRLGDDRWRELLEHHRDLVRAELARWQGQEINTTGDGFLATFDGPARGVSCALAATSAVQSLGIDLRSGLHTGEIETIGDDIAGQSVHVGARIAGLAAPGEVRVSRTVKDLVAGGGFSFTDEGEHTLKGIPDKWQLFTVK